jgi:prepilin-type N-terminal cleavage/methylation domain-containing protein
MTGPRARSGGFTLLEIIIALGILAVGATTALALLVAAASTGRRAEHHVQSALLADSVIAELSSDLTLEWRPDKLESLDAPAAPTPPAKGGTPKTPPAKGGTDLRDSGPAKGWWYKKNATHPAFPDYRYDVTLLPCGGPPNEPWEFFVEVIIRWSERSVGREAVYQTVVLRRVTHLDNEAPPR